MRSKNQSINLDFLDNREQFIPFRIDLLLKHMLRDPRLESQDHESMRLLRRLLADRFHFEYHRSLESLKNDFTPFDPDRETLCEPDRNEEELRSCRDRFYGGIKDLLRVANYVELTREQFSECLKLQPIGGLSVHVDTDDFEEFNVFYRGIYRQDETVFRFIFFRQQRPATYLRRVLVLARFREDRGGNMFLKMFKEVAVENIKVIAPKVKLGMPLFDQFKVGGTVLGSLATTIYKLFIAAALSPIVFAMVLIGLLLATFKGIMSFLSSRTKYMHVFSSSLYYRSLSTNQSAIAALVDAAEEQDVKEALLAYFILHVQRDRDLTLEQIDQETEKWIEEQFGHRLDFEVDDAVKKLLDKEIVFVSRLDSSDEPVDDTVLRTDTDASRQVYKVSDLLTTLRQLDEAWDNFHQF